MWSKDNDWFWEGNVQRQIAIYLRGQGYQVTEINTMSKEAGPDLLAQTEHHRILVEVKGWPSDKYVAGEQIGKIKRTNPTTQAKHWLGESILTLLRRHDQYPMYQLVIGLPDKKKYSELVSQIKWALEKLEIQVYFVTEDGKVKVHGSS